VARRDGSFFLRETNLATSRASRSVALTRWSWFAYIDQRALEDGSSATTDHIRAPGAGETVGLEFDPTTLTDDLRALGLELMEDLGSLGLSERYLARRTDGLMLGGAGHIARARVAAT
jgi:hypothetical protein